MRRNGKRGDRERVVVIIVGNNGRHWIRLCFGDHDILVGESFGMVGDPARHLQLVLRDLVVYLGIGPVDRTMNEGADMDAGATDAGVVEGGPTLLRAYDPIETTFVQEAAAVALSRIGTGACHQRDFPQLEPGFDRRVRTATERFRSGDAVIQVIVNVIEDTKRDVER